MLHEQGLIVQTSINKKFSFLEKIFQFPKFLLNSYYCRHPLKIYQFIGNRCKPYAFIPTLAEDYFFIADITTIKEIMKYPRLAQAETLSEGRQLRVIAEALGRIRLNQERGEMKEKRNVLAHLMTKPERYIPQMLKITQQLVNKWQSKLNQPIDVNQDIAEYTVRMFLEPIMNYQGPYTPVVAILEKQIDLLGKRLSHRPIRKFETQFRLLREQLMSYLIPSQNKKNTVSEYENRLNQYVEKKGFNEEQEAYAIGLNGGVLAGYLAPFPSFLCTVYELGKHPEWQYKILEEAQTFKDQEMSEEDYISSEKTLLNAVIHESLRLNPAQPFLFRKVENDLTIASIYPLNKGVQIVADLYHALRSPEPWGADAQNFNPSRFIHKPELLQQPFIVYSTGPNNCVGQFFSRQTLKILVYALCKNFSWTSVNHVNHKFHFALTLDKNILIQLSSCSETTGRNPK